MGDKQSLVHKTPDHSRPCLFEFEWPCLVPTNSILWRWHLWLR
jgi:hypothetical protein